MAVDMETVISKVEKLLALGTSSNEHEAAAAVGKAQELLLKYGLDMQQVTGRKANRSDVHEGTSLDVYEQGKPTEWRMEVIKVVAQTSGVWLAKGYRSELKTSKAGNTRYATIRTAYFIGLPADVEMAGYAYSFLVGEIERLAQDRADVMWAEIRQSAARSGISVHEAEAAYVEWNGTHPLKAKASFHKGASEGVVEMLWAQDRKRRADAPSDVTALVVNRDAIIRDYWYMKNYGKSYTEYMADIQSRMEANRVANPNAVGKAKTPAQLRRESEQAERRWRRQEQARERAEQRKFAAMDADAYYAGRKAGREMGVRPGVPGGTKSDRLVGG